MNPPTPLGTPLLAAVRKGFECRCHLAISIDTHVGLNVATRVCDLCPDKCRFVELCRFWPWSRRDGCTLRKHSFCIPRPNVPWSLRAQWNIVSFILQKVLLQSDLWQCFSTAGPRPGTGPWHQLYRAARGSPGILVFLAIFMNKYFIVGIF